MTGQRGGSLGCIESLIFLANSSAQLHASGKHERHENGSVVGRFDIAGVCFGWMRHPRRGNEILGWSAIILTYGSVRTSITQGVGWARRRDLGLPDAADPNHAGFVLHLNQCLRPELRNRDLQSIRRRVWWRELRGKFKRDGDECYYLLSATNSPMDGYQKLLH